MNIELLKTKRILVLGDGDFSFSLSLSCSFENANMITATSYDSFEQIQARYPTAAEAIHAIKQSGL
jgi:hypothetical protein